VGYLVLPGHPLELYLYLSLCCIALLLRLFLHRGHTELSVALAKAARIVPVLAGCVMLSNSGHDFGALAPDAAAAWAQENGVPFVEGPAIVEYVLGAKAMANGNGHA
jgi:3,4-dihydroxy 2-butanone 4-phosphate synthase